MQDLRDETIGTAATPSVLTPRVNPDLPPVGEIAADRLTVGSPIDPAELNRSAVETQEASETDLAPAWPAPGLAFDLPIFLRVLPGSGPAVAVAAARDPAMADAVRRLPENLARAEVRTVAKQADISDLPDFLVAAKAPTEAVSPSQGMIAAAPSSERPTVRDPAAAVRRGIVAMAGAEPVVPHRKTFDVGSRLDQAGLTEGAPKPPHNGVAVDVATPNPSPSGVKPAALKALTMSPAHRALQDSIGAATPARQSVGERTDRPSRPAAVPAALQTVGAPMIAESPMWAVGLSTGAPEGAVLDGTAALRQPVGTEAWQDELSAQLSVMAEQGERSEAVMKLAPAELGELEIRIEIRGSEAAFQFGAASIETRHALELAQSRLREMMTGQGISVSEFSIFNDLSNKNDADSRRPQDQSAPNTMAQGLGLGAITDLQVTLGNRRSVGMVDLYA
jgi:flagellar hook-length control protein FliK